MAQKLNLIHVYNSGVAACIHGPGPWKEKDFAKILPNKTKDSARHYQQRDAVGLDVVRELL